MGITGYDAPKEDAKIPSPSPADWEIEAASVGDMSGMNTGEVRYARIKLRGEVVGTVRLPNVEHLIWLRERFK